MRYLASGVAPVRGGTYFSLPPQRKVGKRKRLTPPVLDVCPRAPHVPVLHAAAYLFAFAASALYVRLTRFIYPRHSTPRQTVLRRPGGKLCVSWRAARLGVLARNTVPAFQSGVVRVWREGRHTVCHLGGTYHSLTLDRVGVFEAGEALIRSVGDEH